MYARQRRAIQGSAAAAAGIIQRAYRKYVQRTPMPTLPGGGLARRPARRRVVRGRGKHAGRANPSYAIVPHRVSHVVGQMSKSYFGLGSKVSSQVKALKRVGAPNLKVMQYPAQLLVPFGFQNYFSYSLYNMSDIRQMLNTVAVGTNAGSKRIVLESVQSDITFTNSSNSSAEVEIYDLVLKHDLLINPSFTVNGLVYPASPDPTNYWSQGVLAAENSPSGTTPAPSTFIGSTPFDSLLWKDYFKLKKRTSVMLPQGGTHRHSVCMKPSRLIDEFQVATSIAGVQGLQGLTQYTMIVAKGVPISDTTTNVPTTAVVLLDMIQSVRYKWTWVADTSSTGYFTDGLTTPASANTQVLSAGSGLFANASTA